MAPAWALLAPMLHRPDLPSQNCQHPLKPSPLHCDDATLTTALQAFWNKNNTQMRDVTQSHYGRIMERLSSYNQARLSLASLQILYQLVETVKNLFRIADAPTSQFFLCKTLLKCKNTVQLLNKTILEQMSTVATPQKWKKRNLAPTTRLPGIAIEHISMQKLCLSCITKIGS